MLFDLIESRLSPLQWPIYDSDATGAQTDYYILVIGAATTRTTQEDLASGGCESAVIIRIVGVSPQQARRMLLKTRSLLRGFQDVSEEGTAVFVWDGCPRPVQVERVQRSDSTASNLCFIDDEYTVYLSFDGKKEQET